MNSTSISATGTQWIGGQRITSEGTQTIPIIDPSDETTIAEICAGSPADAEKAISAAHSASHEWGGRSPSERAPLLREAARKMVSCRDEVVQLLTRENGKPLRDAKGEVDLCPAWSHSLIELGVYVSGRQVGSPSGELAFQHLQPRGVAACINTWNAPVIAGVELTIGNLIVGNTVVLKTSEKAPLATRLLFERSFDHLPPGVVNVVDGDGPNLGDPLVRNSNTDLVCFIGSPNVGSIIGGAAGQRVRKVILELGGKDAMIVDETVDPLMAARLAAENAFANAGQICTSTERIYVLQEVLDPFLEELVRVAKGIKVGPGMDPSTEMGPMVDEPTLAKVEQQVESALQAGAEALTGGSKLDGPGYYYPPTVLTRVSEEMMVMKEETFGPVAPVLAVDSFEEALQRSSASSLGLSAVVCTENAPRAIQAIRELEVGNIRINCPRGQAPGVSGEPFKNSGIGIGHGLEFLQELAAYKVVRWKSTLE